MLEAVKPPDHLTYMTPIPGQDNRVRGVRSAELEIFSMPPWSTLTSQNVADERQVSSQGLSPASPLARRLCFRGHDKSCVKSRATHRCSLISDSQFTLIVTSLSIGAKSGCWQNAKIIATPCICLAHLTSKGFAKRHVQPPDDGRHRFKLLAGSPSRSFHQALPRASTSKNIRSMLEYTFLARSYFHPCLFTRSIRHFMCLPPTPSQCS
jgi:hypothetical protein